MLVQALGLGNASKETDQERMVRLGEMTPFGTIINFQDANSSEAGSGNLVPPSPARSTTSQVSDFEKFLMNENTCALQKIKKKRSMHGSEGQPRLKTVRSEPIMSPLHESSGDSWSTHKKLKTKDKGYKFKRNFGN